MKVLFNEDVGSRKKGSILDVANGYARNFLLPKKIAVIVNKNVLKELDDKKKSLIYHDNIKEKLAKEVFVKLDGKVIEVEVKAGEMGKIFGSVTTKNISDTIKEKFDIDIDKKKIILLENEIKSFGRFAFEVKLHNSVICSMYVDVIEEKNI